MNELESATIVLGPRRVQISTAVASIYILISLAAEIFFIAFSICHFDAGTEKLSAPGRLFVLAVLVSVAAVPAWMLWLSVLHLSTTIDEEGVSYGLGVFRQKIHWAAASTEWDGMRIVVSSGRKRLAINSIFLRDYKGLLEFISVRQK